MHLLTTLCSIISAVIYVSGTPAGQPKVAFHHSTSSVQRIIGGSNTQPGEFPWQVSIQLLDPFGGPSTPFCGGAILDEVHILTAAHCIEQEQPSSVIVVAGIHNVFNPDGTEQRVRVSAWEYHENYVPETYNNDVAIIRRATALTFNSRVRNIQLPAKGYVASGICVNTGWGNIRNDGNIEYPEILQKVTLQIFDRPICTSRFQAINPITMGMICAGDERGNKGSCKGDSGGPLVCKDVNNRDVLAGLVSWGAEPCAENGYYPSVFTNVEHFLDWIFGSQ